LTSGRSTRSTIPSARRSSRSSSRRRSRRASRELESDDAIELLQGLDEEDKEEILEKPPPSERAELERSLLYPENSTFVTTIIEVVGFFSFLGIAPLWFGLR
jgi:Mg/Co/Ni transporter MgtE